MVSHPFRKRTPLRVWEFKSLRLCQVNWKGARVVEEARLESVCAARHPEFESLPFRFVN